MSKINYSTKAANKYISKYHYCTHERYKAFLAGAEWREEQDKELIDVLKTIAAWLGNLPDEQYMTKTGPNDAALRDSMVVAMRTLALNVLKKYNL